MIPAATNAPPAPTAPTAEPGPPDPITQTAAPTPYVEIINPLTGQARIAGIDIPVFCHHPKLESVGMCRMCLVEIGRPVRDRVTGEFVMENGAPKIQFLPKLETACTNKAEEGMVVLTNTQKAREGQKSTVEFLLTSHPLDCPL